MALSNCPRCGKTFNKLGNHKVCLACEDIEEGQFQVVHNYLRDNPRTTIKIIADETDVSERLILEWYKSGRLSSHSSEQNWSCERCGASIDRGRLCRRCAGEMQGGIGDLLAPPPSADAEPASPRRLDIGHELRIDKYAR
jgi:hypothetical protein